MNRKSTLAAGLFLSAAVLAAPLVPVSAAKPAARRPAAPQIIALPLKQIIPLSQRACTAKTASGLGYRILRASSGARPAGDATVTVHYIGYLTATGEVFDQGMASSFPVKGVIPGFSEGLGLMTQGSIYRFCIPAAMAYGPKETGPIPPNSDLIFQVELVQAATTP